MPDQDCEVRAGGDIIFRVDDGAAILQLNRPAKRNALSQAMWKTAARYRETSLHGYDAVRDYSLPTIAVIDGLCIGGGNNLALACDIRLASPRAADMPTLLAIRDTIRQVR